MVRETRYLHVGNLPEKVSEEDITEHFKRHGKIQSVRLHEKKDGEDGLTATVAFTDIKSASKAHTSENIIDGKSLVTKYSEGNSGAKGSIVQRTHHDLNLVPSRPPGYSHARGTPNYPSGRKGVEEGEAYDIYSREQSFGENRYSFENGPSQQRGRPRERYHRDNRAYKQFHGTSYEGGHRSFDQAKVDREEGFERPKNPPSPSASHSGSRHSSRTKKKKDRSTSHSQSRSRSHSSSSSSYSRSSSGSSGSHSGSRSRSSSHRSRRHIGVTSVAVKPQRSESQGSGDSDGVVDPEDTRPHGCLITGLPSRSSDTSIRDGLFHQYKKYGKVNAVLVAGVGDDRYAIVSFKKADDAAKALDGSKDLVFFGCKVKVDTHEGIADTDDNEFRPPEAELDEYHPKATRTLFVGNLEKDITTQELKDRFSDYGEIIDIDVKRQGAVSAYAFVQYFDIASVVRALKELDGKAIGSMKIKLGFGKSMPTNCIWLDNVAESVSENFLCKQFSRYGNVSRGVIDKQSGKALVFFTNMDDAQFALNEMRNRILNKKKIVTDFASRECQKRFFEKLEKTGQSQNRSWGGGEGQWDSSRGRGSFRPYNSRGARNFQRGRGTMGFRSHGNQFSSEEYRRQRSYDDYSPGGTTPYAEGDDSYEQELITYSHTQRERAEQGGSRSPSQYSDDLYGEAIRRKDKEHGTRFPERYKDKYAMEYSGSPGSDHMSAFLEEPGSGYGLRYGGHERYSTGGRDGEHSPGPDMPRGYSPEGHGWSGSPSRSRQGKDQHNTPPTPTAEDVHNFSSRDHSPMDSDYFKGQSKMDDFDITEADIKEIQASHSGRKDPFGKYSKKRQLNDSQRREHSNLFEESIQKRMLGRSKAESRKDLVQKVQQIECEISDKKAKQAQRSHDSSSSSGCIDSENEMMENELSKLQNEKEALLSQLNVLENASSSSENENADPDSEKWRSAKRSRADSWQSKSSSRIVSGGSTPKKSGHSSSYMVDSSQGYRKQMEVIRKKEEFPKEEHMRRYKEKKSGYESDNEDHHVLASPHDIPAPFKRRKRQEGSEDSGIRRTYRKKCEEGHMSSDNDEVTLRRLSSGHSSPRTPVFPQQVDHHRQSESEMSACEGHVVSTPRKKEHKHRSQKDEMLIIPLGDDSVPNFELIDPRQRPLHDNNEPLSLPLPKFASYMPALFPPASAYTADNSDNNKSDSPCFSPPSSGSKQSDSSPNDSSGPSDSASGDILGQKPDAGAFFQEEDNTQAQSDQNTETTDSDKRKEEEEALLTNSDTSDAEMDKDEAMDIEERIRRLDEKLSQSSKIPPAKTCAEQLSPISIPTVSTSNTTNSNPIDFYSKYKIRKKGDSVSVPLPNTSSVNTNSPNSESKNGEPSDIVRTVLQRSSVFDQDSERLRQVNSGTSTSARYDDIPKTSGGLIRTKAAAKEMPMDVPLSPLPGSLADRLGNGGSAFPTNFVSTTLASQSSHLLGQVTQVYSPEDVHPSDSLSSLYGNEPKNSEEEEEDCHQQEHFSSDPSPNLVERNSDDSVKCMEVTLPTKYSNEDLVTSGNVVSVLDNICSSAIQPSVDDSSVCADQVDIDTKAGDDDGHVPNCGSNKCDNKAETVESDNDTVISLEKKELMEVDENVCDNKSDLTSTNDCSDNIQKEQDCPKPEDTDSELLPSGQGENEDLLKPKITENSMETKTDGDTVDKSAVPVDIKTETIAENSSAEKESESSECSIKQENLDEPSGNSDVTLVSSKSESKPDGKHGDKETAAKGKLEVLPDKPKVKSEEDSGHGRKRKASPDNIESKPALVATKKEECSDSKRQKVEQIHSSSSVETCDKTEKSKEIKKEPDSVGKKLSSEAHHKDKKKEAASEVENKKDRSKIDSSKDKNSHSKVKTSSIKQKETSAASKDSATKKEAHHSDSSHKHKSSSSSSSTSSTTSSSTKQVADKNKEAQNHGKKSSKDSSSHKSPKLEKSSSSESCNTKSSSEKTKDKDHVRNTTEKVSSKDAHNKDGEKPLTTHNKDGEKPLTTHNKDGEKHLTTHNKEGEKPVVTHNKEGEKPAVTHNKEGEKSVASSSHNKEGEKSTSSNSSKKKKEPKKEPEDSCQNEADTHKGHPDKKDSPDKSSGADAPKPKLSKTSSTEKHKSSGSEKSKESHKHKSSDSGKSKSSSNDGPQKDKSDATSVKSEPVLNKPDSASVSKDKTNHGSHKEKVESKNKKDGTASQDGSKSRDKSVDKNKAEKSHKSKSGEPKHTQSSETKVKQEQNKDMKEDMLKDHQNDQTDKSSKSASKSKVKEEKVKGNGSEKNGTSCKDKERSNNSDKDKNNKNSDKASKSSHSSQLPDCNKTKSADSADKKEGKAAEKAKDSQKAPENHKSQQNSDDKANKSKDSTNSNSTEEKSKKSDKKEKKTAKPLVFSDEEGTEVVGKKSDQSKSSKKSSKDKYHNVKPEEETSKPPKSEKSKKSSSSSSKDNAKSKDITEEKTASKGESSKKEKEKKKQEKEKQTASTKAPAADDDFDWAAWAEPAYESMYDKVKRRSTDKAKQQEMKNNTSKIMKSSDLDDIEESTDESSFSPTNKKGKKKLTKPKTSSAKRKRNSPYCTSSDDDDDEEYLKSLKKKTDFNKGKGSQSSKKKPIYSHVYSSDSEDDKTDDDFSGIKIPPKEAKKVKKRDDTTAESSEDIGAPKSKKNKSLKSSKKDKHSSTEKSSKKVKSLSLDEKEIKTKNEKPEDKPKNIGKKSKPLMSLFSTSEDETDDDILGRKSKDNNNKNNNFMNHLKKEELNYLHSESDDGDLPVFNNNNKAAVSAASQAESEKDGEKQHSAKKKKKKTGSTESRTRTEDDSVGLFEKMDLFIAQKAEGKTDKKSSLSSESKASVVERKDSSESDSKVKSHKKDKKESKKSKKKDKDTKQKKKDLSGGLIDRTKENLFDELFNKNPISEKESSLEEELRNSKLQDMVHCTKTNIITACSANDGYDAIYRSDLAGNIAGNDSSSQDKKDGSLTKIKNIEEKDKQSESENNKVKKLKKKKKEKEKKENIDIKKSKKKNKDEQNHKEKKDKKKKKENQKSSSVTDCLVDDITRDMCEAPLFFDDIQEKELEVTSEQVSTDNNHSDLEPSEVLTESLVEEEVIAVDNQKKSVDKAPMSRKGRISSQETSNAIASLFDSFVTTSQETSTTEAHKSGAKLQSSSKTGLTSLKEPLHVATEDMHKKDIFDFQEEDEEDQSLLSPGSLRKRAETQKKESKKLQPTEEHAAVQKKERKKSNSISLSSDTELGTVKKEGNKEKKERKGKESKKDKKEREKKEKELKDKDPRSSNLNIHRFAAVIRAASQETKDPVHHDDDAPLTFDEPLFGKFISLHDTDKPKEDEKQENVMMSPEKKQKKKGSKSDETEEEKKSKDESAKESQAQVKKEEKEKVNVKEKDKDTLMLEAVSSLQNIEIDTKQPEQVEAEDETPKPELAEQSEDINEQATAEETENAVASILPLDDRTGEFIATEPTNETVLEEVLPPVEISEEESTQEEEAKVSQAADHKPAIGEVSTVFSPPHKANAVANCLMSPPRDVLAHVPSSTPEHVQAPLKIFTSPIHKPEDLHPSPRNETVIPEFHASPVVSQTNKLLSPKQKEAFFNNLISPPGNMHRLNLLSPKSSSEAAAQNPLLSPKLQSDSHSGVLSAKHDLPLMGNLVPLRQPHLQQQPLLHKHHFDHNDRRIFDSNLKQDQPKDLLNFNHMAAHALEQKAALAKKLSNDHFLQNRVEQQLINARAEIQTTKEPPISQLQQANINALMAHFGPPPEKLVETHAHKDLLLASRSFHESGQKLLNALPSAGQEMSKNIPVSSAPAHAVDGSQPTFAGFTNMYQQNPFNFKAGDLSSSSATLEEKSETPSKQTRKSRKPRTPKSKANVAESPQVILSESGEESLSQSAQQVMPSPMNPPSHTAPHPHQHHIAEQDSVRPPLMLHIGPLSEMSDQGSNSADSKVEDKRVTRRSNKEAAQRTSTNLSFEDITHTSEELNDGQDFFDSTTDSDRADEDPNRLVIDQNYPTEPKPRPRRDRKKQKNYREMNSGVTPRTTSPRSQRSSPRSPRNVASPKQSASPAAEIPSPIVKIERLHMNKQGKKESEIENARKLGKGLHMSKAETEAEVEAEVQRNLEAISHNVEASQLAKDAANVFDFDANESEFKAETLGPTQRRRSGTRRKRTIDSALEIDDRKIHAEISQPEEARVRSLSTESGIKMIITNGGQQRNNKENKTKHKPENEHISIKIRTKPDNENGNKFEVALSDSHPTKVHQEMPNVSTPLESSGTLHSHLIMQQPVGSQQGHPVSVPVSEAQAGIVDTNVTMMHIPKKVKKIDRERASSFSKLSSEPVPTTPSTPTPMSNIDKIIDNVSKGIFEWSEPDQNEQNKPFMPTAASQLSEGVHGKKKFASRLAQDAERSLAESQARNTHAGYQGNPNELVIAQLRHLNADPHMLPPHENMSENKQGMPPPNTQPSERHTPAQQIVTRKMGENTGNKLEPNSLSHLMGHPYPMMPPMPPVNIGRQDRLRQQQAEQVKSQAMSAGLEKQGERQPMSSSATAPTCVVHPITTTAHPIKQDALKGPHDLPVSTMGNIIPHAQLSQDLVKEKVKAAMEQHHFQPQHLPKPSENAGTDLSINKNAEAKGKEGGKQTVNHRHTPVSAHSHLELTRPPNAHSHIKPREQMSAHELQAEQLQALQKGIINPLSLFPPHGMRASLDAEKKGSGPVDLQKIVAPNQLQRSVASSSSQVSGHHPQIQSPALAQTAPSPHQINQRPPSPGPKKASEKNSSQNRWTEPLVDARISSSLRNRPPSRDVHTSREAWMYGPGAPIAHQQAEQGINLTTSQSNSRESHPSPKELTRQETLNRQQAEMHFQLQQQQQQQQEQLEREKRQKQEEQQQELLRQQAILRDASNIVASEARQTALVSGLQRSNGLGHPSHPSSRPDAKTLAMEAIQSQHGIPVGMLQDPRRPGAFNPAVSTADLVQNLASGPNLYSNLQRMGMLGMIDPHLYPAPTSFLPHPLFLQHGLPADGRFPGAPGGPRQPLLQSPGGPHSTGNLGPGDALQSRGIQDQGPSGEGSLLSLLAHHPVMWQGVLALKTDSCVVQMHLISGFSPLVQSSLPQQDQDGTIQPLRISQRMRLEAAQLDGVIKRMNMDRDYCMLLALPCGRDTNDIMQQTRAMSTGFIHYLQQKQAAGIVNVPDPTTQQPAFVVHIFPPCEFSHSQLERQGFEIKNQIRDVSHLLIVITTVA